MAGHGSKPDPDRALEPNRSGTRDSGSVSLPGVHHGQPTMVRSYRPPANSGALTDASGMRWTYDAGKRARSGSAMDPGFGGATRTRPRAEAAARAAARRLAQARVAEGPAKTQALINKHVTGDFTPDEVTERRRSRREDYD